MGTNRGLKIPKAAVLIAAGLLFQPRVVLSAPVEVSSTTYLHAYKVDAATGPDLTYRPLYEYLSLDVPSVARPEISFTMSGWGRVDLGDDHPDGSTEGSLGSAFLTWSAPRGNGQARLGRFLLTEGTSMESLDGLLVRGAFRGGVGAAAFVGSPAEDPGSPDGRGSTISGGRIFFVLPGSAEVGISYLREDGDFAEGEREEAGGDLWLRPSSLVDITGNALYNRTTSGLATHRVVVSVHPTDNLTLSAGSEGYDYGDLFSAVLNPALAAVADSADSVSSAFGRVDWRLSDGVSLGASGRSIRHELDDPGSAFRGEASVRLNLEGGSLTGLSAAHLAADSAEDEYDEMRGYVTTAFRSWKISVDAIAQKFGAPDPATGEDRSYQVVGSLGRILRSSFRLSADLRYTKSPRFDRDVAVLMRAEMDLGGR